MGIIRRNLMRGVKNFEREIFQRERKSTFKGLRQGLVWCVLGTREELEKERWERSLESRWLGHKRPCQPLRTSSCPIESFHIGEF